MTKAQILVVEDNVLVAQGLRSMLKNLGYGVPALTASGEEAVQLAGETRPDLVLMDIKLEGDMDGVHAAEQIRAQLDIPVIYLTGYADEATLARAKITEPLGYLLKPCQPRELRSTVEMALYKHEMEGKLKESQERYRTLAESSQDHIFIIDRDDHVEYVNQFAASQFGTHPEAIIGKLRSDLFPPDISGGQESALGSVFETGEAFRGEATARFGDFDGWLDTQLVPLRGKTGEVAAVMGIARDITERKRAEEALKVKDHAIASSISAIALADMAGNLTYVNNSWLQMYECDDDKAVLGRPVLDFFSEKEDTLAALEALRDAGRWEGERIGERIDGSLFDIYLTASVVVDETGEPVCVMASGVDITERKRMEAELHQAQKLESVGLLAGGIAHDFNNLLTTILGNISLAKMEAKRGEQEDMVDMLTDAATASLQARNLTKQLLTFATGGAPVKLTISIANLLRESVIFALRGSKVQCRFAIAEDLWPVDADEGQTGQVINNLVINAQQAMPHGGTITVRAENKVVSTSRQDAGSTKMPGFAAGKYVAIAVEDEGTGIPAEHLSKIFDPYFTTKQEASGLGLATAHSIIKSHGGHISVESTVGEGATFHIYLPASSGELAPARAVNREIVQGQGKVLVMDDEKAVRGIAERLLSRAGYEVQQAAHGAEAIELYRQAHSSGSPFDVVILDLTVRGGMGGVEAIRQLREFDPQVKAIVSSGYFTDAVMADYEGYGFNGVLPKPYEPAHLSQIVDAVLNLSGSKP